MSTTIVLIEHSASLRRLLQVNLETYLGARVKGTNSLSELDALIGGGEKVSLVIARDRHYDFFPAQNVQMNYPQVPLICIGDEGPENVDSFTPEQWPQVIKHAAKILNVTAEDMARQDVPELYPFSINLIYSVTAPCTNVYRQMGEGNFELIFSKDEAIDLERLHNMVGGGEDIIYVAASDRLRFANQFSASIIPYLEGKEIAIEDRVRATAAAFVAAQELISKTGINQASVEMAKATIESMVEVGHEVEGLGELLDILLEDNGSYLYKHSILCAVVSQHLVRAMEWGQEEQAYKMAFVSFFHDITIAEDILCSISSEAELNSANLSKEQRKKVLTHALDACEIIRQFPHFPKGADRVILQHHCSLSGVEIDGDHEDERLDPLSVIFKVVEDFVDIIVNTDRQFFVRKNVYKKLFRKYDHGLAKKTVEALEASTIDS